jgi:hypothetical protein
MILKSLTLSVAVIFASGTLWSQEPKPPVPTSAYKLDYVFSEMQDNKRVNARSFTVLLRTTNKGVLKLGSRVPIATGTKEDVTQIQYLDVGINIDCRVKQELDSAIDLETTADTSTIVTEPQSSNHTVDPVIRQVRYDLESIVPLGKPTLLGSADEADGTRRLQIEVTATKVR